MSIRFLPIGPRSLLVELADLTQTLVLFDALNANPIDGVAEIIPAARTLMIRTEVGVLAGSALAGQILARRPAPGTKPAENTAAMIELPVSYEGEDLAEVAGFMGLSVPQVIAAHQAATWQVAFVGFAPGFAYMTCDDPRFDLPRRASPRQKIPAGALALAGKFSGIYPLESPGGWQLIGRCDVPMFDLNRSPAALLAPGQRVKFVERSAPKPIAAPLVTRAQKGLRVISTQFPILVQDEGRLGQAGQGVSSAGALDMGALRDVNRRLGNPSGTPALEITLGPVKIAVDAPVTLALEGALGAVSVNGQAIDATLPFALDAGDILTLGAPKKGMRSYLGLRGGFDVAPVMGSASRDTLAHIGPEPLVNGAVLGLAHAPAGAVDPSPMMPRDLPASGDLVKIPVTLGPRADYFSAQMIERFLTQDWAVSPLSSRVGMRLEGAEPLSRDASELPSEGTECGAIQIPHSGQPVFFLADHPLTGGYPVIATVLPQALDLAAQIPPGARIRFTATQPFADIEPEAHK